MNSQVHQWLLTFDLEPSWDLSSLAQVNLVKQELGERCRRSFVLKIPLPQICRSISLSSHALHSQTAPSRELRVTSLPARRGTSPRRSRDRFQIMRSPGNMKTQSLATALTCGWRAIMLALTLSGLWKWTGLRTSCRCAAPYLGWYCHRSYSVGFLRDRITSFQK